MAASGCAAEMRGGSEGRIGRAGSGVMLITGSTWWQRGVVMMKEGNTLLPLT
jgi:hypothetical protein